LAKRSLDKYDLIKSESPQILKLLSAKFRSKLVFLKKKFLIWSKEEIESEEAWKKFIDNESWKIWENTEAYEAQFVLSGSK